jgi:hypothetical protein
MGYIGLDINYGDVNSQTGTGDGSDTTPIATLDYSVPTSSSIVVTLDGVTQVPDTDYTVTSGTTLTFTTAPANLVKILVVFLGRSLGLGTPADGTVTNSTTNFQPGTVFKGDGSSTDGKITLNCSQNTHGVSIQSPAHVSAASYTLTLPTTDGNANELLKTDGNGVLSWTPDIDTTNTNASNLVSGTLPDARFPAVLPASSGANLTSLPTSLDATPDTDHTANGPQTNTVAAGYSSTIMDLVYLNSNGKWLEADADATGTSINLLGIALEAKTDTQAMNVALSGSFVRDDTFNWTIGVPLYVSGTLGAITATKPTGSGDVVRTVGYAVTADVIFFAPSSDYVTLA